MCTFAQTPTTTHHHQHTNNNTMNNTHSNNIIINWFSVNIKGNVMNTVINAIGNVLFNKSMNFHSELEVDVMCNDIQYTNDYDVDLNSNHPVYSTDTEEEQLIAMQWAFEAEIDALYGEHDDEVSLSAESIAMILAYAKEGAAKANEEDAMYEGEDMSDEDMEALLETIKGLDETEEDDMSNDNDNMFSIMPVTMLASANIKENVMNNVNEEKKMKIDREDKLMFSIITVLVALIATLFIYSVNITREHAAAMHKQEVRQAVYVADSDYGEVVMQLEEYLDEKYHAENNIHHGIGPVATKGDKGPLEDTWDCTAWKWKGKVYTAEHCVRENYEETMGDVVVSADKYPHAIKQDLYDIGIECSTDLRWWGANTDMWGYIPFDQAFNHYKQVVNGETITNQRFICAASISLEIAPVVGDSGGPLMAGDEVIGFVSYGESPKWNDSNALENFDIKYKDALYGDLTYCWGVLDRSQDTISKSEQSN